MNSLIQKKEDIVTLPEVVRNEHTPGIGDIYISSFQKEIIKLTEKNEVYKTFKTQVRTFYPDGWKEGHDVSESSLKEYYKYVMFPIEDIIDLSNEAFNDPSLAINKLDNDINDNALTTQSDAIKSLLDDTAMLQEKSVMVKMFMEAKIECINNSLKEKMNELSPLISSLNRKVNKLKSIITALNAYIGEEVDVIEISKGEPADKSVPISVRQRILFMDEEVAIVNEEFQGLDYNGKETFYEWLKNPEHRDVILPEDKCVVIMKPKRYEHKYCSDSYENKILNQWNNHSFLLLRNGENVYCIESDNLCVYGSTFPTKKDSERMNSNECIKDSIEERGLFLMMLLQGIVDRTEIFLPKGNVKFSKNIGVEFIYDDEENTMIGTGLKDFRDWIREKSKLIEVGDRIVYNGKGGDFFRYYEYDFSKPAPPYPGIYNVEENQGYMTFKYMPNDKIWNQSSWEQTGRKKRESWVYSKESVIAYDKIELSEIEQYLNDRTQRKYYADIIPILVKMRDFKRQEKSWENMFKYSMKEYFKKTYSIELEEKEMDNAIHWWKMKTIQKRSLKSDDLKSWRMIEKYLKKNHNNG